MKKTKLFLLIVAVLLALVLCVVIVQHFLSPNTAQSLKGLSLEDTEALAVAISEYGRKGEHYPTVELYSWIKFCGKVYYLMELDNQLGYARLTEGLNGGYKLDEIGYGSGDFREMIFVQDGVKYLMMAGRNSDPHIAKITATMDNIVYEFVIGDDADHYFFCVELDPQPKSRDLNRGNVVFYDSAGNDITNAYELAGGGFNPPEI